MDCDSQGPYTPSPDKILFDTGCVSTGLEDCPTFFVQNPICITQNYYEKVKTYGFCVSVKESDLPIGIVNDCDCSDSCNTYWRVCAISPDGIETSFSGGNECLCIEL